MGEVAASAPGLPDCTVLGRRVGFSAITGEVIATERWTETQVSSAPGSIRVLGDHVHVSAPQVWATAVGRKAMWLRTMSGEVEVPVPETLAVRPGHHVHVLVATSPDRGVSQWAAVCNHGTNCWTQMDRYPPGGHLDNWTGFLAGFGQGLGNLGTGFVIVYGVLFALMSLLFRGGLGGVFVGFLVGCAVALAHLAWAGSQASSAEEQYTAGIRAACDRIFADHASVKKGNA